MLTCAERCRQSWDMVLATVEHAVTDIGRNPSEVSQMKVFETSCDEARPEPEPEPEPERESKL